MVGKGHAEETEAEVSERERYGIVKQAIVAMCGAKEAEARAFAALHEARSNEEAALEELVNAIVATGESGFVYEQVRYAINPSRDPGGATADQLLIEDISDVVIE